MWHSLLVSTRGVRSIGPGLTLYSGRGWPVTSAGISGTLLAEKTRLMTRKQLLIRLRSHLHHHRLLFFDCEILNINENVRCNVLLLLQYSMNDFSQLFAKIRSAGFLSTLQKSGLQEVNTSFWMVLWFIPSIWIRKLCCTRKKIPHILSGGSFVLIFLDIQCSFLHLIVNCQAQLQVSTFTPPSNN